MSLQGRDLLSIHDLTCDEVQLIMQTSTKLKELKKRGQEHALLKGKTLGMIFQKSSTRTRVSFEVGMWQLGGMAIYLNDSNSQIGRGEPIKDTARVLSRYVDAIMIRTFSHEAVEELAYYADIPVINGLTDKLHPCQALTDIFTAREYKGDLQGKTMVYIGDGNNMAQSLMFACARVGMNLRVATPAGYDPDSVLFRQACEDARETGSKIEVLHNIREAVEGADVLYTDVWASMGQEKEQEIRRQALKDFTIDAKLLKLAAKDAIVMHCLPAHRGEEITDEVMECSQSVVFDQAENRLHVQKAIMALLMGGL